jgi:enamine deaminase RidA (YjgF/YER057c/UK114 family)
LTITTPVKLPNVTTPGGRYLPVLVHNDIAYVSGHLPKVDGEITQRGKVGADCTPEAAGEAARTCLLACLASLNETLGSLDRIERVLKVTGYVASAPGFNSQTQIMDATSDLLIEILGAERGEHARSSVGVFQLPGDVPVEIDMICAVRPS